MISTDRIKQLLELSDRCGGKTTGVYDKTEIKQAFEELLSAREVIGFYSKCDGYCAKDECVCTKSKAQAHLARFKGVE